ncbi:hypothetical protein AVEN_34402-1 [Araneus ventricosus]|uniref:Uncharacterized protein n=1 Tax=Araneus ventricosus TaxID=182803 RepID=A0A4Y2G642_ARAVE|nr:hypothetical protein AVEN_34402-1 [Araneus ventricosus]
MLSTTHNLSEKLKKKKIDLSQAIENVTSVSDLLSKQRVNANDNFKFLYAQVKEIAAKLGIKEEIPRVCRLQTARNNVSYSAGKEYYRRAVYVPYLDDFCNSLNALNLTRKQLHLYNTSFQNFVPKHISIHWKLLSISKKEICHIKRSCKVSLCCGKKSGVRKNLKIFPKQPLVL